MSLASKELPGLCFFKSSRKIQPTQSIESNKCITCSAVFDDITEQKQHFKSEWHLYNVKRKGSGISTISEDEFVKLKEGLAQIMAQKNTEIESKNRNKLSRKSSAKSNKSESIDGTKTIGVSDKPTSQTEPTGATSVPYDPVMCIFSGERSQTMEDNIKAMGKKYSFFIPEREYLVSPDGLLGYLYDKIHNQYTCIYCHKPFGSIYAVNHHMEQKQHRKLNDDDLDEVAQFYDFTRSYAELMIKGVDYYKHDGTESTVDRDDSEYTDDDDDWEDVITPETEQHDAIQTLSSLGLYRARISPSGNLTLPNGREAIHRDISYVYKQHLIVRSSYGMAKGPTGFQFLPTALKKQIKQADKLKRTKLDHGTLKAQYKSYKLFVPCNQIAYAT